MSISVIIPTFRNPDYLDLCLKSVIAGQVDTGNQFIVIIDGFPEMYAELMKKYRQVDWLPLPENKGQTYAHNTGVTLAENEQILIVNDDNVFPYAWDRRLNKAYNPNRVIAPNQIEPNPSIFRSFIHKDFGTTPESFSFDEYIAFEAGMNRTDELTSDGQTWPVFMSKKYYMAIGGIDPGFPSPAVADWDFFMRLEMIGMDLLRYKGIAFYHFAGAATKKADSVQQHNIGEHNSHVFFAWKWGFGGDFNPHTHSKIPHSPKVIRGINFNGT